MVDLEAVSQGSGMVDKARGKPCDSLWVVNQVPTEKTKKTSYHGVILCFQLRCVNQTDNAIAFDDVSELLPWLDVEGVPNPGRDRRL